MYISCLLRCEINNCRAQIYISNFLFPFFSLTSIPPSPLLSYLPLLSPPSAFSSLLLCGISVQCRSDAENSPVLFWLHLTLLLVFSCIVRSYSLTSSKQSPVGKTVHKHRRALSGRYIFNLTGCRSRVKQQQSTSTSALLRIDYLVSVKYKI